MRLARINKLTFFIALRYSFSRQRNRFIGVVSMVSLFGMALGVASLIAVLSVMNGFADELRSRILSVVPHAQIEARIGGLEDWLEVSERVALMPRIIGIAPYIETTVLAASQRSVQGAQIIAIDTGRERSVSHLADRLIAGSFSGLDQRRWGVVLGSLLARSLGVTVGDSIELIAPRLTITPLGSLPRSKHFTVVGLFEVGAQLDSSHGYIQLRDGQALMGTAGSVQGLRLAYEDLFSAPELAMATAAQLGSEYRVTDWGQSNQSLFSAVRMEKTVITILLLSVVAVAAFNIVSTLTMAVTEKRADIAVLRTLGAGRAGVMAIFVCQGLILSLLGITVGAVAGGVIALNISEISQFIESLFGVRLFDPQVYFISQLPSRLALEDVVMICVSALLLSLLATLAPAWRASEVRPAEVLRYE